MAFCTAIKLSFKYIFKEPFLHLVWIVFFNYLVLKQLEMPTLQNLTHMKTHTAMAIWSNHSNAIKRSNGKLASQHIPRFIRRHSWPARSGVSWTATWTTWLAPASQTKLQGTSIQCGRRQAYWHHLLLPRVSAEFQEVEKQFFERKESTSLE